MGNLGELLLEIVQEANKEALTVLDYLNVQYITDNIEEIIQLEPLLPMNVLLNLNDRDKIEFVANTIDNMSMNNDERVKELRNPSLRPNEKVKDYEIRRLYEFIDRNPKHRRLIKTKYR